MAHQHQQQHLYTMPYMAAPGPQYMMPTHAAHPHAHAHAHGHVHLHHGHMPSSMHMVSTAGPIRTAEMPQRKRPKYTRSKTGCLTCRGKKIKCDETKPNCTRCANGQRDCVWPEPAPVKKQKNQPRKSSTAENSPTVESRSSGSSTSRDPTPNSREQESGMQSQTQSPTLNVNDERRHSGTLPSYSYLDHAAPLTRAQPNGSASHTPQGTPPLPMASGANLSSYQPISGNYDFSNGSPNGSASSPNNSRPSTANSIPPTHYAAPSMQAVETRDYPRWDQMAAPRPEVYATTTAYYG